MGRAYKTSRDFPVTIDADGRKCCRWCKGAIPKGRRTLCSDECGEAILIQTNWNYARRKVELRDKGVCAKCGCDTERLKRLLRRALADWGRRFYNQTRQRWEYANAYDDWLRMLGFDTHTYDLWQADHILEVVRGGSNDLANLQTLCVPCHKEKTKQLAKERAQERRDAKRGLLAEVESISMPVSMFHSVLAR